MNYNIVMLVTLFLVIFIGAYLTINISNTLSEIQSKLLWVDNVGCKTRKDIKDVDVKVAKCIDTLNTINELLKTEKKPSERRFPDKPLVNVNPYRVNTLKACVDISFWDDKHITDEDIKIALATKLIEDIEHEMIVYEQKDLENAKTTYIGELRVVEKNGV